MVLIQFAEYINIEHHAHVYQIILEEHHIADLNVYMMKSVQRHWHAFVISVKVLVTVHAAQMHIVQFCIINRIVFVMKAILAIHILDADLLSNVSQFTIDNIAEIGLSASVAVNFGFLFKDFNMPNKFAANFCNFAISFWIPSVLF